MIGLGEEDNIIVSELSRLGRSMLECMEILSIALEKRIDIYAVKGAWQLDQSIQSKIIAMAFSMTAEIERDLISQRTKEALAAKKKQGVKLGRPKVIPFPVFDEGIRIRELLGDKRRLKRLGLSEATESPHLILLCQLANAHLLGKFESLLLCGSAAFGCSTALNVNPRKTRLCA